jgi:translation initiation factor 2 subunit 2
MRYRLPILPVVGHPRYYCEFLGVLVFHKPSWRDTVEIGVRGYYSCMTLSMDDYDGLLDRALSKITQPGGTGERFEVPIAQVQVIGARTIVVNFSDVVDRLNRDPHHVLKYLAKEMATAGSFESGRGYFQGKFSRETINRLIGVYSNRFVICPVCRRPDTRIVREGRLSFLVCEACGARSSILTT